MQNKYVYLVIDPKRLVITDVLIKNENFHFLYMANGDVHVVSQLCKAFCAGFVYGHGVKVTNLIDEFKS